MSTINPNLRPSRPAGPEQHQAYRDTLASIAEVPIANIRAALGKEYDRIRDDLARKFFAKLKAYGWIK